MPSTKSLVLALALTAPAAALVPPATQRVPATIRHADDAARAARREALMQASERAAARIEATRNSGQSTPMRPDDMMAFVKPATEAQAPDEMSYVPTDDEGRANYAVGGGESGMDRSSMKERFSRAPEGHTPHYNTGEGYFADLTRDSSERHWTKNDGKTAGYDTIKRQFGQRPDRRDQSRRRGHVTDKQDARAVGNRPAKGLDDLFRTIRRQGDGRPFRLFLAPGMDDGDWLIRVHPVADAGKARQADGWIDDIGSRTTSTAEFDDGDTNRTSVDGGHDPFVLGIDRRLDRGLGQIEFRLLHEIGRAAEGTHHLREDFRRLSAFERATHPVGTRFRARSKSAGRQQLTALGHGDIPEPVVDGIAFQEIDGVLDLHRIAGGGRQRFVHVGDQRGGLQTGAIGDQNQAFGQRARVIETRHEGAGAPFDVEHQPLKAGGELLRQDRGGDQVEAFHRRGHVADGVEASVGGGDLGAGDGIDVLKSLCVAMFVCVCLSIRK